MSETITARVFCADARSLPLPNKSVDLVFCSPPYEAARTYGIGFNLRGQAWVDWAVERFMECLRICRGLVAWVIAGQTRQYRWSAAPALFMADLHRRGVNLRNPPIFHRVGIPGSGGPDWLRADYEWIVCASALPGRLPWSDNKAMGHPPRWAPGGAMSSRLTDGRRCNQWGASLRSTGRERNRSGELQSGEPKPSHVVVSKCGVGGKLPETRNGDARRRKVMTIQRDGMHNQDQFYSPPAIANPGNVIRCKVGGGLMGSRLAHENEAPFPEALAEFFIRSFCPPEGVVLDPFSGSGTTAAVAIRHGRNAIASDIRESQCQLTRRRITEVQAAQAKVVAEALAIDRDHVNPEVIRKAIAAHTAHVTGGAA